LICERDLPLEAWFAGFREKSREKGLGMLDEFELIGVGVPHEILQRGGFELHLILSFLIIQSITSSVD
jgi:hypothetical protein